MNKKYLLNFTFVITIIMLIYAVLCYRWSVTIKSTFDLYCGIYSICIASGLYFKQTGRINWYDF